MTDRCDIAIVGAGMAGASLAAALASRASVTMIEAESTPGYHATGRSAAFWEETYGGAGVMPLTLASGEPLRNGGFLTPRGALYVGRDADRRTIDEHVARFSDLGAQIESLDRAAVAARLPGLRVGWTCGSWQARCADIDVAGLHAHYLARARRSGVELRVRAALAAAERRQGGSGWRLSLADGSTLECEVLANAAGAWADAVATMAGARPLGINPLRRTVAQLRTDPTPPADLPLVLDVNGGFYFKPESGRLWLSPHDETPSPACDAAPEEFDVAVAIDRFQQVVDWTIAAVERKWAGLRSFAPDRLPVYGYDPEVPGFFWCAGQGGFGIQTAPAGSALAAGLLLRVEPAEMVRGIDPARYAPHRFS